MDDPQPLAILDTRRKTKSAKELSAIIDHVILLLNRRFPKHAIKRAINERFFPGNPVGFRTIESYLSRARQRIAELSGKTKADHRRDAHLLYESIIADPDATYRDRMAAQLGLRELMALDESPAPQKFEHSGPNGGPLQTQDIPPPPTEAELDRDIASMIDKLQQRGGIVVPNVPSEN